MPISKAELKRLISAEKQSRDALFLHPGISARAEMMAHRRKVAERLEPYFAKTGIEVNTINQILAQSETNLRRAVNQRATRTKKLLAADKNRFRRIVDARRRAFEQLTNAAQPDLPAFVALDTPFLIWSQPQGMLSDSGIEPFANFAKIRFDLASDDEFSGAQQLSFYFLWENQNDNVAVLDVEFLPYAQRVLLRVGKYRFYRRRLQFDNVGVTWLGPVANDRVVFAARCGNARHRVFRRGRRRILGR